MKQTWAFLSEYMDVLLEGKENSILRAVLNMLKIFAFCEPCACLLWARSQRGEEEVVVWKGQATRT